MLNIFQKGRPATLRTSFKVRVTRSTNSETGSASCLPNGKAYKLPTSIHRWRTKTGIADKRHDLQGQRSRSRCHRERKVSGTLKLIERLPTPQAIMHTSFKVKGQKSRSPGRLMLRPEVQVRHIFRTERPTNF